MIRSHKSVSPMQPRDLHAHILCACRLACNHPLVCVCLHKLPLIWAWRCHTFIFNRHSPTTQYYIASDCIFTVFDGACIVPHPLHGAAFVAWSHIHCMVAATVHSIVSFMHCMDMCTINCHSLTLDGDASIAVHCIVYSASRGLPM